MLIKPNLSFNCIYVAFIGIDNTKYQNRHYIFLTKKHSTLTTETTMG